jgi:endonuclease YncB( thermonuclease family)
MKINLLRDVVVTVCFLVLLSLIAMKVKTDAIETLGGRYRVVDGDSLALGERRLRLIGIDAPELTQTCKLHLTSWRCGEAAKAMLQTLVGRGATTCKGDRRDKYGRLLVACLSDGLDINREMVRRGLAVAFGAYEHEEAEARLAHTGLWASDFVRPVDWRRSHHLVKEDEPHRSSFFNWIFGGAGS